MVNVALGTGKNVPIERHVKSVARTDNVIEQPFIHMSGQKLKFTVQLLFEAISKQLLVLRRGLEFLHALPDGHSSSCLNLLTDVQLSVLIGRKILMNLM